MPKRANRGFEKKNSTFTAVTRDTNFLKLIGMWKVFSLSPIWQPRKGLPQNKAATKKLFSAETSLIHKTDAFLKGIDDKKFTACVLLDMSKAFDSVDLQILLRKIRSVGA